MSDPRDEFLENVDFKDVKIKEHPNIAFLCGGNPESVFDDKSKKQKYFTNASIIRKLFTVTTSRLKIARV